MTSVAVDSGAIVTVSVNGSLSQTLASGQESHPILLDVGDNTITLEAESQDQSTRITYTLIVTRAANNDADLAALQVEPGNLQPGFTPKRTVYTVTDVGNTDVLKVTATLSDPQGARLSIASENAMNNVTQAVYLNQGANLIPIVVTAADGLTEKTYVLSVNGMVSNANLASLSVDSFAMQPNFSKDVLAYSVAIPNQTDRLTIQATAEDPKALVMINGKVIQATQGQEVALRVGENIIAILVVAQDGTTKTYQVTILRAASGNANLADLSLSEGTLMPMFTTEVTDYSGHVPHAVEHVQVTATPAHSQAQIAVRINNGSYVTIDNGLPSAPLALETGENIIEIQVTSEDRLVQKIYSITMTRGLSNNADLSDITLGSGAILNEPFDSVITVYTADVPYSTASITVRPIAIDLAASITVSVNGGTAQTVQSGQDSTPLQLGVGANTITLDVESEDGSTRKTYTVEVTRAFNNNANLVNLEVHPGNLQPAFAADTTIYKVLQADHVDVLKVTATLADSAGATLTIAGDPSTSSVPKAVYLNQGANLIPIVVTAADGVTSKTYALSVNGTISNADLVSLSVSSGELQPVFSKEHVTYQVRLPNQTAELTVWARAEDPLALVIINGNVLPAGQGEQIKFQVGENSIPILVLAQDGTTKTYTVQVTREAAGNGSSGGGGSGGGGGGGGGIGQNLSNDAELADLQVWANKNQLKLSPMFTSNITKYTAQTEVDEIEIRAKAAHSKAKVLLNDQLLSDKSKVDLQEDENRVVLIVQAENGIRKEYTLIIYRERPKLAEPTSPSHSSEQTVTFGDIVGHWAESDIKRAVVEGIVSGYPDGTFKPNNPVTRSEFTVMLVGALKLDGTGAALQFKDQDKIGAWAKRALALAVQAGVVSGYEDGSFRPDAQITRAEMASMIAKSLKVSLDANVTTGFADDEDIPKWAKGAVEAICKLGIVSGRGGNQFVPNNTATRAEAVVMLLRMLEQRD